MFNPILYNGLVKIGTKQGRDDMQQAALKSVNYATHQFCEVNNARYCYLEAGEGPLVVLIHGYPDNAYSWEHQITFLSQNGFRVIAPFTRGYLPTTTPDNAFFDRATLATDIQSLIYKLNHGCPAYLVGQDWGAAISYGVLGAFPHSVKRAVLLAVPHPVEITRTLRRSPKHILRSFHWFVFQLPWLPERLIQMTQGRFLHWLWRLWSPAFTDHAHVEQVVSSMLKQNSIADTLAYYRAALQQRFRDPALSATFDNLNRRINTPTKVLCGQQDMRKEMLPRQADLFASEANYQWQLVENAGHFLHREQPDGVNQAILYWFRQQ